MTSTRTTPFIAQWPADWLACGAALGMSLLSLAGCGPAYTPRATPPGTGRQGVISMAPNLTETVFALGQGESLIAVGDYDDYPPEVNKLPRVGGYLNPDLEKITLMKPELLLLPGQHQKVTEYAALNQLPISNINMDSLVTIDQGIQEIGNLLGAAHQARMLRDKLRNDTARLRSAMAPLPRPRVLVITSRQPRDLNQLYTAGGGTFVGEIVDIAGGENIYGETDQRYLEASKETLVMKAPEVILEFHCGAQLAEEDKAALIADWQAMPSLPAVKDQRIYIITDSHALRPGPRIIEVARILAGLLHPGAEVPG